MTVDEFRIRAYAECLRLSPSDLIYDLVVDVREHRAALGAPQQLCE